MTKQFADFPFVLAYALLGILFLLIGKWVYDLLTPYKIDHELTKKDNPAVGTAITGYFVALIIIIAKLIPAVDRIDPSTGKKIDYQTIFHIDLIDVAIYGLIGIFLLNFSRLIVDKLILYKFKINKELIDDRNVGTGAVLAGSYIASGLVIAAAVGGDINPTEITKPFNNSFSPLVSGILLSLIFFALGQATLIIYSFIYSWFSPYNAHEEIEKDNVAAGISFGGGLLALGIILYKGLHGDSFVSWTDSLTYFGWLAIFAIVAFPLIRWFVNKIMLPKADLSKEIVEDRNVNAAFLEIVALNMVSAVVLFAY